MVSKTTASKTGGLAGHPNGFQRFLLRTFGGYLLRKVDEVEKRRRRHPNLVDIDRWQAAS